MWKNFFAAADNYNVIDFSISTSGGLQELKKSMIVNSLNDLENGWKLSLDTSWAIIKNVRTIKFHAK